MDQTITHGQREPLVQIERRSVVHFFGARVHHVVENIARERGGLDAPATPSNRSYRSFLFSRCRDRRRIDDHGSQRLFLHRTKEWPLAGDRQVSASDQSRVRMQTAPTTGSTSSSPCSPHSCTGRFL